MLRLLGLRRDRRRLGAIGLDHHQTRAFQKLFRIDAQRFCTGFLLYAPGLGFGPVFMHRWLLLDPRRGFGGRGRLRGLRVMLFAAQAQRFLPLLFPYLVLARLEALRRAARAGLSRTLVAALAMPVATAAAPPAAVLLALALGRARPLALLHLRLLRLTQLLRIARLLRLARLLRRPRRPLLLVGTALAALALAALALTTLAIAAMALATRLPVAALLEPALLLAVAVPLAPFALP